MNYQEAYEMLKSIGQEHVLRYFDELSDKEQTAFLSQIEEMDFSVLTAAEETSARGTFAPLAALRKEEIDARREEFEAVGLEALRAGKIAAVLLAGGQGTRLGSNHPKGTYNIGFTRELTIFECLMNRLKANTLELSGVPFHFCIMTSELNHDETVAFFEEKDYFGYPKEFVHFFIQDMAPCTDLDGKLLMSGKGKIAVSPNGNGGWFSSLSRAGLLDLLKRDGVEYISVFGVDNVLVNINDPAYIGAVVASGADSGGKVVVKADPNERVGVLCLEDGKPSIVEYYEMTDDMIHLKDADGRLLYAFGAILNYCFRIDKLEEIAERRLMVHKAMKRIDCLNEDGILSVPTAPNGYKYELLVLDLIHMMDSCLPFEVEREKEFAPIKNAKGIDSVETAQELLQKNGVVL